MTSIVFGAQRLNGNAVFQSIQASAAVSGTAVCSVAPIQLSSPAAIASGDASASGALVSIGLVNPAGRADVNNQVPASASGDIKPIYLTVVRGSASPDGVVYARAPSGSGYRPRVEISSRPAYQSYRRI